MVEREFLTVITLYKILDVRYHYANEQAKIFTIFIILNRNVFLTCSVLLKLREGKEYTEELKHVFLRFSRTKC